MKSQTLVVPRIFGWEVFKLDSVLFSFDFKVLIYLSERQKKRGQKQRKSQIDNRLLFICWFIPQMPVAPMAGPGPRPRAGTRCRSPTWLGEMQLPLPVAS